MKLSNILLSFLLLIGYADNTSAQADDARVIAHADVSQNTISERQLRRVFMLKQRSWEGGQAISLVVFSSENEKHAIFLRHQLKLFPYQLEREWNKLIFSGQSAPPIIATDTETMLRIVSSTPGAIGYIVGDPDHSLALFNDADHRVKTLEVTTP